MDADSLYRAQLERYAASLAAASVNPSVGLGAAAALSPYTMLAAGYSPAALGLVPASPIIQPPMSDTFSSSSLNLSSLSSSNVNAHQHQGVNQTLATGQKSTPLKSDRYEPVPTSIATNSPVLQQRLSNTTGNSIKNETFNQKVISKVAKSDSPSIASKLSTGIEKEAPEHRKDKKKIKAGISTKSKSSGK